MQDTVGGAALKGCALMPRAAGNFWQDAGAMVEAAPIRPGPLNNLMGVAPRQQNITRRNRCFASVALLFQFGTEAPDLAGNHQRRQPERPLLAISYAGQIILMTGQAKFLPSHCMRMLEDLQRLDPDPNSRWIATNTHAGAGCCAMQVHFAVPNCA